MKICCYNRQSTKAFLTSAQFIDCCFTEGWDSVSSTHAAEPTAYSGFPTGNINFLASAEQNYHQSCTRSRPLSTCVGCTLRHLFVYARFIIIWVPTLIKPKQLRKTLVLSSQIVDDQSKLERLHPDFLSAKTVECHYHCPDAAWQYSPDDGS